LINSLSPKFTVALIRTPRLSPYHAKFLVPLSFSKFDLRDYLYHAYNVRALSIRSYIHQQPVRDHTSAPRSFFRPDAKKYMTIEMDKPFVWPAEPESWDKWMEKGREEPAKAGSRQRAEEKLEVQEMEEKRVLIESLRKHARSVLGEAQREGSGAWEKGRTEKWVGSKEGGFGVKV
jgi:large subunit ribosomal protein L23